MSAGETKSASPDEAAKGESAPARLPIFALRREAIAASIALRAIALANVAYLLWHVLGDLFEGTRTAPARAVGAGLAALSALPWIAAWRLERSGRGALVIEAERLVIDLGRTRFEIPIAKVKAARGSAAPWHRHAVTLVLASGKAFERRLVSEDPRALVEALVRALPDAERAVPAGPLAYAAELCARTGRPRWLAPIKWGLAPLGIAVIAFRLQQIILFGGPFGQLRRMGVEAYLVGFFDASVSVVGDLVLYATTVRAVVEVAAIGVTWIAPRAARPARLGAEGVAFIAFFVVVPGFLASRLLG